MYDLQLQVHARRASGLTPLADRLVSVIRNHVGDITTDRLTAFPKKRGGRIVLWTTIDVEYDNVLPALRAIADEIDSSANLIDRVDEYTVAVSEGGTTVLAFVHGEYRGWLRDNALEDLKEGAANG